MPSASHLRGLYRFLERDQWRDAFLETQEAHFSVAARTVGIETEAIGDIVGDVATMTLWGCVFEDFLAREVPGRGNIVDDYLKRRGYKESATAKAYMRAIRHSVMSLYEVSDIIPGQSFLARDLVRGGEPVRVMERSATTQLRPWGRIGARIVQLSGAHVMCGGLLPYDRETADKLLETLRRLETRIGNQVDSMVEELGQAAKGLSLVDVVPNGTLLSLAAPFFTREWLIDMLDKTLNPRLPELSNTDGDAIVLCTQRFPLAPGASGEKVRAALAGIEDLRQASDSFFNWIGPDADRGEPPASEPRGIMLASSDSEGGNVLGGIEIGESDVVLTTNSRERAERARAILGSALGDLAGAPSLDTATPEQLLAEKDRSPSAPPLAIPPEEKRRLMRAYFDNHYRKTLDEELDVLGGLTPRQAARTPAGRDKVVDWLKQAENLAHQPGDNDDALDSYDFTWMWKELDLLERRV
jgi:hypothetical protein